MDLDALQQIETEVKEEKVALKDLILYNDDENTFEYVIDALVNLCDHDSMQAEQCTFLVHYKGKCGIKRGPISKLRPLCEAMLERGLSVKIE
jgi:ATP-dependent Clp protease adaptor protein ClpS